MKPMAVFVPLSGIVPTTSPAKGNSTMRKGLWVLLVTIALGMAGPAVAAAQSGDRPLSDFLTAQGTSVTFWPPFPDYLGWANNPNIPSSTGPSRQCRFAGIDYAGLSAQYLKDNISLDL